MPSTFLLQQMIVKKPKVTSQWKKSKQEINNLLSLEELERLEKEIPDRIRTYLQDVLNCIPNDQDQRYQTALVLYNKTTQLPRAHDALRVLLCYL